MPWTLIAQIINFLVFVAILYYLLYKPVRRIMQARKDEMEAELRAAEGQLAEAEKIRAETARQAKELEEKREDILKKAREAAEEQRRELLKKAEDEARERLERFRRVMEQERSELLDKITDDLRETIVELAGSILGDASEKLTDRGIERVAALLADMPPEELQKARDALAKQDNTARVRSASALGEPQINRLKSVLAEKLGADEIKLKLQEDRSLLAGLEVTLGHINLAAHWRGAIDEALRQKKQSAASGASSNPKVQENDGTKTEDE